MTAEAALMVLMLHTAGNARTAISVITVMTCRIVCSVSILHLNNIALQICNTLKKNMKRSRLNFLTIILLNWETKGVSGSWENKKRAK